MASAPSASALSAVLRCRGKFLARNQASKRPRGSICRLGLTCGPAFESGHAISRQESPDESWTNRLLPQDKRNEVAGMTVSVRLESAGLLGHRQTKPTSNETSNTCEDPKQYKHVKTYKSHNVQLLGWWLPNLNANTFESIRRSGLLRSYDEVSVSLSTKSSTKSQTVLCVFFDCKRHDMNTARQTKYEFPFPMSMIKTIMFGVSQAVSDLVLEKLRIFWMMSKGKAKWKGKNKELIGNPEAEKKGEDKKIWKDDSNPGT